MDKPKRKWLRIVIQSVLVLIVLGGGFFGAKKLISMKKATPKKARQVVAPLVNVQTVKVENTQMIVSGYGSVQPRVQVQVVPQVSGQVLKCHKDFVNGGFFKAGEALITIDSKDYELAMENAGAEVARQQVLLDRELAEAKIARQEWGELNPESEPSSPLVFRQPQINQAEAQLRAAKANLAMAKLNLDRTIISMPFDGRVASESVDIGQFLNKGQSVATVYGTDSVEIVVPLEDRELAWLNIPSGNSGNSKNSSPAKGSKVEVSADFAGGHHKWEGKVIRTEGRIDPESRLVNIAIEVKKPFELSNGRPALVPGMFVGVSIKGKQFENVIRVHRYVIHNNHQIWVASEGRLNIREVEIVRKDADYVYITSGLEDGELIVVSPLDNVTDQMRIRANVIEPSAEQEESEK